MTVETIVCSNCGKGDWTDYEPGDSLRCPWCESLNHLVRLEEYKDQNQDEGNEETEENQ